MKRKIIALIAMLSAMASTACWLPACTKGEQADIPSQTEIGSVAENNQQNQREEEEEQPTVKPTVSDVTPKAQKAEYLLVNGSGVNLRSGAGSSYSSLGVAEKGTLYISDGLSGSWYKTRYKDKTVYINKNYCTIVQMDKSENERIEKVIAEGCKYMGVTYVYGATRYHDGNGNKLKGFTASVFDCSSLMQYIFKTGADINLQVNTRTQIYQGETVKSGGLKRGDLMFFTNASRKNNTGVERVGHVALYLGDNYILHTASDYAKIEQITSTRWSYYIQAQRIL
ncbi:MAG: C40 family peptidase [Clostridia bacterium]|nr:C40 family peptidase [Clostridia bacterium]